MKLSEIPKIYKKYHVPLHVIAHMEKVQEVAEQLSNAFIKKGIKIRKTLIKKGALLHDVLRICDFRTFEPEKFPQKVTKEDIKIWLNLRRKYQKIGHAKAMSQILKEIKEYSLAEIVEKHDFLRIDDLENWEEKILYYADKRVDQDRIVPLEKRLTEGAKRNRNELDRGLMKTERKIFALEKEIIFILGKLPI